MSIAARGGDGGRGCCAPCAVPRTGKGPAAGAGLAPRARQRRRGCAPPPSSTWHDARPGCRVSARRHADRAPPRTAGASQARVPPTAAGQGDWLPLRALGSRGASTRSAASGAATRPVAGARPGALRPPRAPTPGPMPPEATRRQQQMAASPTATTRARAAPRTHLTGVTAGLAAAGAAVTAASSAYTRTAAGKGGQGRCVGGGEGARGGLRVYCGRAAGARTPATWSPPPAPPAHAPPRHSTSAYAAPAK